MCRVEDLEREKVEGQQRQGKDLKEAREVGEWGCGGRGQDTGLFAEVSGVL